MLHLKNATKFIFKTCEKTFDSMQVDLQFEQHFWGKQMPEKFEDNHGFYDPMAEYME